MLENDAALASHLSRNHQIQQYAETEEEKTLMQLHLTKSIFNQGGMAAVLAHGKELFRKRHAIGSVILCPETYETIMGLYSMSGYYHNKHIVSSTWATNHLMGVSGGVSIYLILIYIE